MPLIVLGSGYFLGQESNRGFLPNRFASEDAHKLMGSGEGVWLKWAVGEQEESKLST